MSNPQYDNVCKAEFVKLHQKLDKINDKLFIDNGHKSVQSKLNNTAQLLKIITGVFAVIGGAIVSVLAWIIKAKLGG